MHWGFLLKTANLAYGTIVVMSTIIAFILTLYGLLDATGATDGQITTIIEAPEEFSDFLKWTTAAAKKYVNEN